MSNSPVIPVKEIEVPVPWGHVAGKVWGDEKNVPVVVLHGILDNCSSFDSLIPLLPKTFYYICLDLPGHGKSSHFPQGLPLDFHNFVLAIKLVTTKLGLPRFEIIAHSLGCQISLIFSAVYPELVNKLVCLDGVFLEYTVPENTLQLTRKRLEDVRNHVSKNEEPPSYTADQVLHKLLNSRYSQLTEEGAKILMTRATMETTSGLRFSADHRHRLLFRPCVTLEQMQQYIASIQCPVLLVLAKDTQDKFQPIYGENYIERLEALIYGLVDMKLVAVQGNHDVHLNYPHRVAPHIIPFLLKQKSHI